jgi:DNA adenine methylase
MKTAAVQLKMFDEPEILEESAFQTPFVDKVFKTQLLKWVGNKQRFAPAIIKYFPERFQMYHEPFLGSGGVLGVLAPRRAFGSDGFRSLIEIWQMLASNPTELKAWYEERWKFFKNGEKVAQFEAIKARYNLEPNAPDLLFIARACYGGVVRFRMKDSGISTPCGAHEPVSPESFAQRVDLWHARVGHVKFECMDYREALARAQRGDLVYCDPPYVDTQAILYGAQAFRVKDLFDAIIDAKRRGVFVALSIDGTKKSGDHYSHVPIPHGLFSQEIMINCGRSMLRRFQREGEQLHDEVVKDRLLLTY